MGGITSNIQRFNNSSANTNSTPFDVETTIIEPLSSEEAELKAQLSNGVGVQYIRSYAQLTGNVYLINIWDKIESYQLSTNITSATSSMSELSEQLLLHSRVFPMAKLFYEVCFEETDELNYREKEILLNHVKRRCLGLIWDRIFRPFTETHHYKEMKAYFNNPDCWVTHACFEYLDVIATGAFGVVCHCRKITTNQHYAMKIQPKDKMLKVFRHDKHRVTSEFAAGIVFNHPYIAGIAYAFQTEHLTMLVSTISACGDLRRSLNLCPNNRMSLDRVVFYTAEIISALMYLHRHDIMYRDLKPANVLLNADGHIMLADFGSLAGKLLYCEYRLFDRVITNCTIRCQWRNQERISNIRFVFKVRGR